MSRHGPVTARAAVARPYRWLRRAWHSLGRFTPFRQFRAMQLRRMTPLNGGRVRGTAVVRHYWASFLDRHRADVRGHALEVGAADALLEYGGDRIIVADVIDVAPRNGVTIVADLSRADHLPANTYDCFIVPFTAHFIYDIDAALYHALRILKPGGVLLINFPCVDYDFARGLDMGTGKPLFMFWWFTPLQVANLLRNAGVRDGEAQIEVFGNLFAKIAYQVNLPAEELTQEERDRRDPGHPLLICAKVTKSPSWSSPRPTYRDGWTPDTTPARWNAKTGHYPRE